VRRGKESRTGDTLTYCWQERETCRPSEARREGGEDGSNTYWLLRRDRREGQAGRGEAGRERKGRTGATLTIYRQERERERESETEVRPR
jgi:hypothetical protein